MKKIWTKFKHWLIKKLGGQVPTLTPPKIEYRYERPIPFFATITIDFDALSGDIFAKEQMIKQKLANEIAKELLNRRLIDIAIEEDPIFWQRRYKARVLVISTKGADNEHR